MEVFLPFVAISAALAAVAAAVFVCFHVSHRKSGRNSDDAK